MKFLEVIYFLFALYFRNKRNGIFLFVALKALRKSDTVLWKLHVSIFKLRYSSFTPKMWHTVKFFWENHRISKKIVTFENCSTKWVEYKYNNNTHLLYNKKIFAWYFSPYVLFPSMQGLFNAEKNLDCLVGKLNCAHITCEGCIENGSKKLWPQIEILFNIP